MELQDIVFYFIAELFYFILFYVCGRVKFCIFLLQHLFYFILHVQTA